LHIQDDGDATDDGDAGDAGDYTNGKQTSGCSGSDVDLSSALFKLELCASCSAQRNIVKLWRSKVSTSKWDLILL